MLRVVTDPAGEVVGTAMLVMAGGTRSTEGYVERLAVRKDQRGQGLAQALLVDAFEQGRAARRPPLRPLDRLPHRRARASTRRSAWSSPTCG